MIVKGNIVVHCLSSSLFIKMHLVIVNISTQGQYQVWTPIQYWCWHELVLEKSVKLEYSPCEALRGLA